MTKAMGIAVGILLTLFAGCAVFFISLQRDEMFKKAELFLLQNTLQKYITFQSVSVPIFDVMHLKNLTIKSSPTLSFPNTIDQFTVHTYETKNNIPISLKATANNVSFNFIDVVKSLQLSPDATLEQLSNFDPAIDIIKKPFLAFLLAGCDKTKADIGIDYTYLPISKRLFLSVLGSDKCLGSISVSFVFENITNAQQGRLMTGLKNFLTKGYPAFDIEEFLKDVRVSNFQLDYTAGRFVTGYKKFVDSAYFRHPNQPSIAELDAKAIQSIVSYLSFSSAHKPRNIDLANALGTFIKNPTSIRFQSKAGKEVDLRVLRGDAYRQFTELLLRLDVTASVSATSF